jgi:Bacterial Ig-like domain (group 3)
MPHSSRSLRRTALSLLWAASAACAAQSGLPPSAHSAPLPRHPADRTLLASLLSAESAASLPINPLLRITAKSPSSDPAPAHTAVFTSSGENHIAFSGTSAVATAVADFDGDGFTDYAFALSPTVAGASNLCIYFGVANDVSLMSGGNAYPPAAGKNECISLPAVGPSLPNLTYIAAAPLKTGELPGLLVEDSANNILYVIAGTPTAALPVFSIRSTISIPASDGPGPIYFGDLNGDGNTDFIVNGQNGLSASVYLGNGDGTFLPRVRYTFDHHVRSMQLQKMSSGGPEDMVVEGDNGVLEVFSGNPDGSFATSSQAHIDPLVDGSPTVGPILAADLDGDGCTDILVPYSHLAPAQASSAPASPNALYIWYGDCHTAFSAPQIIPLSRSDFLAAVGDFTGDGLPGIALSDGAQLSILNNQGHRTFAAEQLLLTVPGTTAILATDLDRNGTPDLALSSSAPPGAPGGAPSSSPSVPAAAGFTVLLNSAGRPARHFATGTPTITTLDLCLGGSAPNCPITGVPSGLSPVPSFSMIYGQVFNGTEGVTATDGTPFTGTGTLTFYQDGVPLCVLAVNSFLSCPATVGVGTTAGTHIFTSIYSGDSTYAGSTSNIVTITVSQDTTVATVAGSPNPSPAGQPVVFTATLIGNNAPALGAGEPPLGSYVPPSGTVVFLDGSTVIGRGTLTPGATGISSTATITTSTLPVGKDPITVSYAGDLDFTATASPVFTETILPVLATATTLTSSLNPSYSGQSVTFTATVVLASSASSPVPTGTVSFLDGGTLLGTGSLNSAGVATYTTSTLAVGSHNITATASGDTSTAPSTSPVLVQVVDAQPPPGSVNFSITVTPNPVSIGVGNGAQLLVTVTPLNGFLEDVTLSCGNLPTEAACRFINPAIPAGGGTSILLLTTTAPHSCGSTVPYFLGSGGSGPHLAPFALPALAGLFALFVPGKRRRWLRGLIAMVTVALAMQFSGCGNCTDLGTRPATYTIQVSGTAISGTTEIESKDVTLTVTI